MAATLTPSDGQNATPRLRRNGSAMNSTSDGNTSQKMLVESAEIFALSCVSCHSHIIASNDVSGSDTSSPPMNELRLEISDTATRIAAEMANLRIVQVISFPPSQAFRIEQRLHGFEVLLLQLDVSGNRHRTKPVMPVRQCCRLLELLDGVRTPLAHFRELRLITHRLLRHLPLDLPLCDEHRSGRLLLTRLGCLNAALVPVPQRQRHCHTDTDLGFVVARAFLRNVRADAERWISIILRQRDLEALLFQLRPAHLQLEVVRQRRREQRIDIGRGRQTER